MTPGQQPFSPDESFARALDEQDPLRRTRALFALPASAADPSQPAAYFCGNSLGCMPVGVPDAIAGELDDWARLAVDAHLHGRHPWLPYHEVFRETGARLVGARPGEVVMMNSLTVNLHLLMVSFYRPTRERFKIVIEDDAFPSDSYAVRSQAEFHALSLGFDPEAAIIRLTPREREQALRTDDILAAIEEHGDSIALVLLGGVNYLTGQFFDMPRITAAGKSRGCMVGWDLAHAAGNVPLALHDWDVDFAAWCSYKYLNSGPGAVAGAFVHERHARKVGRWGEPDYLPRFAGWWGNDPATRFEMVKAFTPRAGADAWQLSNPPILAMAPLRVSLEIFDSVGMDALRAKSLKLTGYLEWLLTQASQERSPAAAGGPIRILTPSEPGERGCQLSLAVVRGDAVALHGRLHTRGIVSDFRAPNVIRVAPVPLYTTFHDVWRLARGLASD